MFAGSSSNLSVKEEDHDREVLGASLSCAILVTCQVILSNLRRPSLAEFLLGL